jgi:hypothetical protein
MTEAAPATAMESYLSRWNSVLHKYPTRNHVSSFTTVPRYRKRSVPYFDLRRNQACSSPNAIDTEDFNTQDA